MTASTNLISEESDSEVLASEFSDEALERASEITPINRSSILATFNDPTQLCC